MNSVRGVEAKMIEGEAMIKYITEIGTAAMLCVTLALVLTGCGHEHTWIEATCTEPKTCTECGNTEGEALGHSWIDATCAAPKTCTICAKTEGEALPHTLTQANFQAAATCSVCGAAVGEPLTPYFTEHGIPLQRHDEGQICIFPAGNTELDVNAWVILTDYNTFDSDDTHPSKEEYEYRTATMKIYYSGENFDNYGVLRPETIIEDYFDSKLMNESGVWNDDGTELTYFINYNGTEREVTVCIDHEWNSISEIWTETFSALVPKGYNGVVVGTCDSQIGYSCDEGFDPSTYVDGHYALYRLY